MSDFIRKKHFKIPSTLQIPKSIRQRVLKGNAQRITDAELKQIGKVYQDITNREFKEGCSDCVTFAFKMIRNWINGYEVKQPAPKAKNTVVETVGAGLTPVVSANLDRQFKPKLADLRKAHPHIKATSVAVFLQKLSDEQVS